jgi:hypothetical protein
MDTCNHAEPRFISHVWQQISAILQKDIDSHMTDLTFLTSSERTMCAAYVSWTLEVTLAIVLIVPRLVVKGRPESKGKSERQGRFYCCFLRVTKSSVLLKGNN